MAGPHTSSAWLVIDIGNTHTVAGLYDPRAGASAKPLARVRFRTDPHATADEYRSQLMQIFTFSPGALAGLSADRFWESVERVILSTVVPPLEPVVERACHPKPFLSIQAQTRREFELDLPQPNQLGADRLANVTGALALARAPFLIVDAGTATTFCLVDDRPAYIGGAIVPGLEVSWKALQARAAKLFSVQLTRPQSAVGRTTETQLQSGVLLGYEALIEGMTDRLLADAGWTERAQRGEIRFLATGGIMQVLKLSSRFQVEADLTLMGLLRYGQLTR